MAAQGVRDVLHCTQRALHPGKHARAASVRAGGCSCNTQERLGGEQQCRRRRSLLVTLSRGSPEGQTGQGLFLAFPSRLGRGGDGGVSVAGQAPPLISAAAAAAAAGWAMVEQADDAPLLFWAEGPAVSVPEPVEPRSCVKGSPWGSGRREPVAAAAALAGTGGRLQEPDTEQVEEDQIVAVFVVTFDPRTGKSPTGAVSLPSPSLGLDGCHPESTLLPSWIFPLCRSFPFQKQKRSLFLGVGKSHGFSPGSWERKVFSDHVQNALPSFLVL